MKLFLFLIFFSVGVFAGEDVATEEEVKVFRKGCKSLTAQGKSKCQAIKLCSWSEARAICFYDSVKAKGFRIPSYRRKRRKK